MSSPEFTQEPLGKHIKRYTTISATIDMLRTKKIVLADPRSWDDRNDRYFMALHKRASGARGLYAMCATRMRETYHHWRVFTGVADGACIEFKRAPLEKFLETRTGVTFGEMRYVKLEGIKKLGPKDAKHLPFMKRIGFIDECEYRIIFESDEPQRAIYALDMELEWINRITLNPWLPESQSKSVILALKSIDGCGGLKIGHSKLIDSEKWKMAGDKIAGKISLVADRKVGLHRKPSKRNRNSASM
jgi:hypothetical protein